VKANRSLLAPNDAKLAFGALTPHELCRYPWRIGICF